MQYLTYDWFRDIWIPGAGAILIPVAIAFFTWFFGASRLEKNKETQELKANLNFLLSMSISALDGLIFLDEKFSKVIEKENIVKTCITTNNASLDHFTFDDFCSGFVYEDVYKIVNEKDYVSCIEHQNKFVIDICRVKNLLASFVAYVQHRNDTLKSIADCENMPLKLNRCNAFILEDLQNSPVFLVEVYRVAILLIKIINDIGKLANEMKIKLTDQQFTEQQTAFLEKTSKKYDNERR